MELSEFLKRNEPAAYNFEFENKVKPSDDIYLRYFEYKANCEEARASIYESGKSFAENVLKKYGNMVDCDGTLGKSEKDTCMLAREIYRSLWGWKDYTEKEKIERFGLSTFNKFGLLGPETMNSAQTVMNMVIKKSVEECENEKIKKMKKGKVSKNFMIELFANDYSNSFLKKWLDDVIGLQEFLNLYHTIGNFVLVPAYFNPFRSSKVDDYWDRSLVLLKEKNRTWISCKKEIQWDRDLYIRYVNYFFLWEYTDKYKPVIISKIQDMYDLEKYLAVVRKNIHRRGKFMVAMLQINKLNTNYYKELMNNIFNTDEQFDSYENVIEKIKKMSCYSDTEVKKIIKLLEEVL